MSALDEAHEVFRGITKAATEAAIEIARLPIIIAEGIEDAIEDQEAKDQS